MPMPQNRGRPACQCPKTGDVRHVYLVFSGLQSPIPLICADRMRKPGKQLGRPRFCPLLHMIPKAGHWVQQEFPAAVNRLVIDWLQRRFRSLG